MIAIIEYQIKELLSINGWTVDGWGRQGGLFFVLYMETPGNHLIGGTEFSLDYWTEHLEMHLFRS